MPALIAFSHANSMARRPAMKSAIRNSRLLGIACCAIGASPTSLGDHVVVLQGHSQAGATWMSKDVHLLLGLRTMWRDERARDVAGKTIQKSQDEVKAIDGRLKKHALDSRGRHSGLVVQHAFKHDRRFSGLRETAPIEHIKDVPGGQKQWHILQSWIKQDAIQQEPASYSSTVRINASNAPRVTEPDT
jgi:hypothetical protein